MPGFSIGGGSSGVNASIETLRTNRFKLSQFLGNPGDKPPFDLLKDVDLPERLLEELQVKTPGGTYKYPKQAGVTDLKLIFYATKDTVSSLESLQDKVHTVDTGINDFNDYMDTVVVQLNDNKGNPLNTFTFINAFIGNITYGQLSYGSSEIKLATTTVKFSSYKVT